MPFEFAALTLAMGLGIAAVVRCHEDPQSGVIALGAVGCLSFIFMLGASAPQAALFSTLFLAVALGLAPRRQVQPAASASQPPLNKKTLILSGALAGCMALSLHVLLSQSVTTQAEFLVGHSYFVTGGRNLVQMIHADFRALDALLGISLLGALWVRGR